MDTVIIVTNPAKWDFHLDNVKVISASEYLSAPFYAHQNNLRVFNLCHSHRYQSLGYYVSLLAEARGHKVLPSILTIHDFRAGGMTGVIDHELSDLIQTSLKPVQSNHFTLSVYFEKNTAKRFDSLAKRLSDLLQIPLFRVEFVKRKEWKIKNIKILSRRDIPESHVEVAIDAARQYFSRQRFRPGKISQYVFDLAILVNPEETTPPSNDKAIKLFVKQAEKIGMSVELITKQDFSKIPQFDALLIRETTSINHYTYQFARYAAANGLVVIDDPGSIMRCSNKVYLTELLQRHHIDTPRTIIVRKDNYLEALKQVGVPSVLKAPDGSFSKGVIKITDAVEGAKQIEEFLDESDLLIIQEYLPSEYDWRIGVLDKKPLYACKYFMAKNHWQIYNWAAKPGHQTTGNHETLALSKVPEKVLKLAVRAANLIGDGLYGVDIKQIGNRLVVIEVNDNASIETGVEDVVLGEELYYIIMQNIFQRIIKQKRLATIQ